MLSSRFERAYKRAMDSELHLKWASLNLLSLSEILIIMLGFQFKLVVNLVVK